MNSVDALDNPHHIALVGAFLEKHYGPLVADCWNLGLQTTLRISDLLNLKYADIKNRAGKKTVVLQEGKTGKEKLITLNDKALAIIQRRQKENPNDQYLFQSHSRNINATAPVSRQHVANAIAEAGRQPGINLRLSSHSMRKTRALAIYRQNNNDIALVMELLNHSSPSATRRYLGLTQEKVQKTYEVIL